MDTFDAKDEVIKAFEDYLLDIFPLQTLGQLNPITMAFAVDEDTSDLFVTFNTDLERSVKIGNLKKGGE